MTKLHEVLAAEKSVVQAADKLFAEATTKFSRHTEYLTGSARVLRRVKDSPEDQAVAASHRRTKELATTVPDTLAYTQPYLDAALDLKLSKHLTNQKAAANIEVDGKVLMRDVPVDFLLDLEATLPKWRALYAAMPTLDPSVRWVKERDGAWKTEEPVVSAQTEKTVYPVIMAPATDKHPAQVKESSRDTVVGTFEDMVFSGAATSQQKADALALCDRLIVAVKQARMRANSTDVVQPTDRVGKITQLFSAIFK